MHASFPAHGSSKPLTSAGLLLVGKNLLVAIEVQELHVVEIIFPAEPFGDKAVDVEVLAIVHALAAARTDAVLAFCQSPLSAAKVGLSANR